MASLCFGNDTVQPSCNVSLRKLQRRNQNPKNPELTQLIITGGVQMHIVDLRLCMFMPEWQCIRIAIGSSPVLNLDYTDQSKSEPLIAANKRFKFRLSHLFQREDPTHQNFILQFLYGPNQYSYIIITLLKMSSDSLNKQAYGRPQFQLRGRKSRSQKDQELLKIKKIGQARH